MNKSEGLKVWQWGGGGEVEVKFERKRKIPKEC